MIMKKAILILALVVGTWALGSGVARAGILYQTDFEEFTAGSNQWAGAFGWVGNNTDLGVHGIDQDVIVGGGLGRTAFIGFNQPASTLVSVSKPINYDPGPGDLPIIEVETIIGIQDSIVKPNRDSFLVSILNSDGDFLAGVHFANHPTSYGVWREDGVGLSDTGVLFFRGELHLLHLRIDLQANLWSADLDGIPLFENATFTATPLPANFGELAYEWMLNGSSPTSYGDNWMLVADTIVRAVGDDSQPLEFSSFFCETSGATLTWGAGNGFDYQVEYSNDLSTWFKDMPGSEFPGITSSQTLMFNDPSASGGRRYYRVLRAHTP
jgi:hypothetical protein